MSAKPPSSASHSASRHWAMAAAGGPPVRLPNLDSPSNYEDVEKERPGKHRDQTNPFTVVDVTGDRERFMEGLFWHFGGKTRRMSKAIRIEYTYKGADDKEYKQHLLIGDEGAGGGM